MNQREHWTATWSQREPSEVSWFQAEPTTSLRLATSVVHDRAAASVIDVGGGVSVFALRLIAAGFGDVTVLDIADEPLKQLRRELDATHLPSAGLHTVTSDFASWRPDRPFDLWHDRAGYHFLTEDRDRARYRSTMADSVAAGGHAIMAMFGPDGPEQ
jgi:trans-aconitate methyltransferase